MKLSSPEEDPGGSVEEDSGSPSEDSELPMVENPMTDYLSIPPQRLDDAVDMNASMLEDAYERSLRLEDRVDDLEEEIAERDEKIAEKHNQIEELYVTVEMLFDAVAKNQSIQFDHRTGDVYDPTEEFE